MTKQWTISLWTLAFLGCGVEVGNPGNKGGTTPATGSINISFAKEWMAASESLSLNIAGLDLLEGTDDTVVTSLTATVSQVDLLGLTDASSDETLVANSTDVPIGVYDRIVVRLGNDRPVRYRGRDGADRDVTLDSSVGNSFYVTQSFEVEEGKTTSVVVSLDPYSSLKSNTDGSGFTFKPRGGSRLKDKGVRYAGSTTIADAEWLCAYAYRLSVTPEPGPEKRRALHKKGAKSSPGAKLDGRQSFSSKANVIKDFTTSCENAFAKVPVIDGKYQLRHLAPGSYTLRYFKADGSYEDQADDITLGLSLAAPSGPRPRP
ncbi:MAG: DUF4382 domain-containing protein [Deltaproteobacteria bacterium]|nr:DUF4382 domain-containing protein [Deltaproteobacteria bacterium]